MATNLQIDDKLIVQAVKLGGHRTKRSAVTEALIEYIERQKQRKIISLFGKVDFDSRHNCKKQRARK